MRARGPHHAIGLYAHLTWHTWRREPSIRRVDAAVVAEVVLEAAHRCKVRVHAQAVLADHVHVLLSYSPDVSLSSPDASTCGARRRLPSVGLAASTPARSRAPRFVQRAYTWATSG